MPLSRRDLILGVTPFLGAALAASRAEADVAWGPPMRRPAARVRLVFEGAHVTRREAPRVDVELLHQQATLAISRQQRRIERCVRRMELRDAPNRRRARTLTATLTFDRSGRPRVRVGPGRGVPEGVRACVREALSAIAVRAVPQGRVTLEVRYALR